VRRGLLGYPHGRWVVCGLLFLATTSNYIDRQILGVLAPTLQSEIGWSELEYGAIVTAFQLAYALGFVGFGRFVDRFGARLGYSVAVVIWSLAAVAHAFARTPFQFGLVRFALGLGEAGNFPSALKVIAEWFPAKERALATGIFNAGTNVGAMLTPLVVPWLVLAWGWRFAFVTTGSLGFLWLAAWLLLYSKRTAPNAPAEDVLSWSEVARLRGTWAFALAKFATDPIWWFYLYWIPKYLHAQFGLTLGTIGMPLILIYLFADVGSVGGGWLSSRMIARGADPLVAKQRVMFGCAVAVVPVVLLSNVSDLVLATALLALAASAHQAWSANLFATTSDLVPQQAVASVVGIGGMAGAIGGMLIATFAGAVLEYTGSYFLLFCISASSYLVAWLAFYRLTRTPHGA
jgi:ACS family hexuronate transporter-like MFS transporter